MAGICLFDVVFDVLLDAEHSEEIRNFWGWFLLDHLMIFICCLHFWVNQIFVKVISDNWN